MLRLLRPKVVAFFEFWFAVLHPVVIDMYFLFWLLLAFACFWMLVDKKILKDLNMLNDFWKNEGLDAPPVKVHQ